MREDATIPNMLKSLKEKGDGDDSNQMRLISDSEEVLKFLEFIGKKSVLNENTIQSRMTACNHLFSILEEEEDKVEYLLANLDLLIHRFKNKNPKVLPSTLKVYKSGVKHSLEDFIEWSKNPLQWERKISEKGKTTAQKEKKQITPAKEMKPKTGKKTLVFPLRKNSEIEITIPESGISLKELLKIGFFLYPYCKEIEPMEDEDPWSLH